MNVLLSTSNSNERLPQRNWKPVLLGALLIVVVAVAGLELALANRGFEKTLPDSMRLWIKSRAHASALGERALILVGNSRIRMDIDMDALRDATGLEPVQLGVDGARSSEPILQALADDPSVRGTVLVSYLDTESVPGAASMDDSQAFEAAYRWWKAQAPFSFQVTEDALDDVVRSNLRSYADGTNPMDALKKRVFAAKPFPQFTLTLPDRSQAADFTRVPMPGYYIGRVQRWLNDKTPAPADGSYAALAAQLQEKIADIPSADNTTFVLELPHIESMIAAIRQRGGRVYFINLPSSGMIHEIEKRRYPRAMFWDKFKASTSATAVNVDDDPVLSQFICPDGSHLDYRQRTAFTEAAVRALGLGRSH